MKTARAQRTSPGLLARRVGAGAVLTLCMLIGFVLGAVGHLDLPVARRAAARITSDALSDLLRGRVVIGGFERLKRHGITATDIEVFDPAGRLVLKVERLTSDVDLLRILDRVFGNAEKLSIEIERVSLRDSEVHFLRTEDLDPQGQRLSHPSIQDAFEPVPTKEDDPESSGRPVRIWFPHVALDRVHARGSLAGLPLIDANIERTRAQILASEKGASIDIAHFKLTASGMLGVDTDASGEMHLRLPGPIWGKVQGRVGETATAQAFRFERDRVDVRGQLPDVRPEAVRPLLPEWPFNQPIHVENHIFGELSDLKFKAALRSRAEDDPSLEVEGSLHTDPPVTLDFKAITHSLDLHKFHSDFPATDLDSESQVELKSVNDEQWITVRSRLEPSLVSGIPTPQTDIELSIGPKEITADLRATETGLSLSAQGVRSESGALKVAARVSSNSLAASSRLRGLGLSAHGKLSAEADATLEGDLFQVRGHFQGSDLRVQGVSVPQFSGDYSLQGTTKTPEAAQGSVTIKASEITSGDFGLSDIMVQAEGTLLSPHVDLSAQTNVGRSITASFDVQEKGQVLSQISATVSGEGPPLDASAKRISLLGNRIKVEELTLMSIGEVRGDLDWGAEGGTVKLDAKGLKLARISQVLGLAQAELAGDIDGSVDLKLGLHSEGHVDISVKEGAVRGLSGITLRAQTTIQGQKTEGSLQGSVDSLGELNSNWAVTLAGSPLYEKSYRGAAGTAKLGLHHLDLRTIAALTGAEKSGTRVEGEGNIDVTAKRTGSDAPVELEFSAKTKKLALRITEEKEVTVISGLELDWAGALKNGNSVESALRVSDRQGPLASVNGSVTLPFYEFLSEEITRDAFVLAAQEAPLNLVAVIPRRSVQKWPDFIPRPVERGSVSARLAVSGNLKEPDVSFTFSGKALEGASTHVNKAFDLSANGRYLGSTGSLRSSVTLERAEQRIGTVNLDVVVPMSSFSKATAHKGPLWTGEAQVLLDNAPLDLITDLKERQLSGTVQGALILTRTTSDASLALELKLRRLTAGGMSLGDAMMEGRTHADNLIFRAQFNDEFGSLTASAEMGVIPTPLFLSPSLDESVFITLESERYDAAVLLPLSAGVLDELSGPLSGKLRAEYTPPSSASSEGTLAFSGRMSLTDGVVTPTALGLRLSDVRLNMQAGQENGLNVIRVTNLAAKARSKAHNIEGNAVLRFKGTELTDGQFDLFPEKVPVLKEGAEIVTISGEAKGRFEINEEGMHVEINVKTLSAVLPDAETSNLIELSDNSSVTVLQNYNQEKKEAKDSGPPLSVKVNLSDNVRIKSSIIDLRVRGDPEVRIAGEVSMRGHVQLIPGGRVIVMGRGFVVERGTVMFDTGEVDDPHLDVVASWRAPNNVLVRATVGGTAKRPTLAWASDPALPGGEPEILSLVIGSSSSEGSAGLAAAAWAANEAIGLQGVELYTNQDAAGSDGRMASLTDDSWSSYTAAIRLNEQIWFEGSYMRAAGTGPRAQQEGTSGVSGTIDWRFHPNWSARTEVGSLGGGIDLQWQYRY